MPLERETRERATRPSFEKTTSTTADGAGQVTSPDSSTGQGDWSLGPFLASVSRARKTTLEPTRALLLSTWGFVLGGAQPIVVASTTPRSRVIT